ncbi:virulence factor [Streptomyces sp. SID10853]|uniref:RICIN domain-containing protein n=1 Tax=Streptomyces sp. SID10853 TaxID=2706028 RepID=UPI0013C0BDC7|nr:RICIN domain-containing protein [Streptomyces sp. SID10853]NDZ80398.1 virulence factor [Streptomyces sp. SID10853]
MPGFRRSGILTPVVTSVAALAVLGGLAVRPELLDLGRNAESASDSYDWYEDTAAEKLRQDQCLMGDVLRLGGPSMAKTAQGGLNQTPEQLRVLADRQYWQKTPLATAYTADRDTAGKELDALGARPAAWQKPLSGLTSPAGFTQADFQWPPGSPGDGRDDFYSQTGLGQWAADRFWKDESDFYEDSTPTADAKTLKAVDAVGTPLYGKDPDPTGLTADEWNRALAEHDAFQWLQGQPGESAGADDARIVLASGGFPHAAPQPGSAEYRIAVEDLKSRFAGCAWRDPIDPDQVLGGITATAATEWQQEIASQQVQRNQVLDANTTATKALATGAKALGELLGQSWIADHLARWQDYWSAGGAGWVGDAPGVIEVHAAKGKCLDVQSAAKTDGTPVQVYKCNGTAAQAWRVYGDDVGLHLQNVNSNKCLDVNGNAAVNGTQIQIWGCHENPAQTWEYNLHATTSLKNVGTGKCLDLHTFTDGLNSQLYTCNNTAAQQFDIKPSGHTGQVPPKAQFDQATKGVAGAQAEAKKQLTALKTQAATAKTAATASDTAESAAYAIADKNGAPRGRGLLVGEQKAQVTQGASAALAAMVKAGETAEAATRASGGDSETVAQRALAQAAQVKTEFRKEAAHSAELQAKAAADAAKVHRDNAKKDKEEAEAKLAESLKAESDAKTAAAQAHAKRLAAEAEEKTAKAEKETAAAKQAEAAEHKKNAEAEATKASDAKDKAEASEATAVEKRDAAVKASDAAKAKRDDAWDAEEKANAARAKADAKDAYADSLDAGDAADAARTAANEADKHADDAETAAGKARSEADAATQAAADADAAATRAEAAAKRARSDADGAQAAKLKADAAVKTATSAAADAIAASQHAASEARTAVKLADDAEAQAKTAKTQADTANKEAGNALAASAKAAGFAHVTAQAAEDAGNAAAQVAKPANDAIQLGSPYVTTDSAASLVVLTGQASKTIAEQQKAVADAHAKNAQEEAATAKALADQAGADTKAAYQSAANAAGYAADARTYAKDALSYAADAATAASKATAALARTITYDNQATADATAADKAAGNAEGYATNARDSADQAALDAGAARAAANQAEQDAKDARAAADSADTAATEAEQAAKDALKYAKDAQQAAEDAERNAANTQISTGAGTGIGGTWYVVDEDSIEITDAKQHEPCEITIGFEGCTTTFTVTFSAVVDFFLCTDPDATASASGCSTQDTVLIDSKRISGLKKDVTRYFSKLELIQQTLTYQVIKAALVQDFVDCWHGSASGCAWALSNFIPGKAFAGAAKAIRALDAAMHTGVGVQDAYKTLKALDLDAAVAANIKREVDLYEDLRTACTANSFPGNTKVLMSDGSRQEISSLRPGDTLMATDPASRFSHPERVSNTFSHEAGQFVQVSTVDHGSITTTPGHRVYVTGRGWVQASDLQTGDGMLTPSGTTAFVADVRAVSAPQTVYDLTVSNLHTFYVLAGSTPVLVHNCNDIVKDGHAFPGVAHAFDEHVKVTQQEGIALAAKKSSGKNSAFSDLQTAQQVVDYALANKATAIRNWLRGTEQQLPLVGTFGANNSLGWVAHADGKITQAGNRYRIILQRQKGHRFGYFVLTAFPE